MFKNKEERNAYERKRRLENPEAARKARENAKRSYAKHHEVNLEKQRKSRFDNPEKYQTYGFRADMKRHGASDAWFVNTLIEQFGVCALCKHLNHYKDTVKRLQVDHDHMCCTECKITCGKCNRGLLCIECNTKLAYLEEFLENSTDLFVPRYGTWLEKALAYILYWKNKHLANTQEHAEVV